VGEPGSVTDGDRAQKRPVDRAVRLDRGAAIRPRGAKELWFLDATEAIETQGFRRIFVTEPEHPYLADWWPQGHMLGWEHPFVHEVRDFLCSIESGMPASPSFADALAAQRVLTAIESSATARGCAIQV